MYRAPGFSFPSALVTFKMMRILQTIEIIAEMGRMTFDAKKAIVF